MEQKTANNLLIGIGVLTALFALVPVYQEAHNYFTVQYPSFAFKSLYVPIIWVIIAVGLFVRKIWARWSAIAAYGLLLVLSLFMIAAILIVRPFVADSFAWAAQATANGGRIDYTTAPHPTAAQTFAGNVLTYSQVPELVVPWLYELTISPMGAHPPSSVSDIIHPVYPLLLALLSGAALFLLFQKDIKSQFIKT